MNSNSRTGFLLRYRHANLLAWLLIVIGLGPFFEERQALIGIVLAITLTAGAIAAGVSRKRIVMLAVLGSLFIAGIVAREAGYDNEVVNYGTLLSFGGALSVVALTLVQSLFRKRAHINMDTLCAALSAYLIFGMIWWMAYMLLETAEPGSFLAGSETIPRDEFHRLRGFSYATLTTLGYGNIAPATPKADGLAMLEAITGQVYLAVVIARLVAIEITVSSRLDQEE